MGYYITFVFDPATEKYDREKLIKKFIEAGAEFIVDHSDKHGGFFALADHLLLFGDYPPRTLKKGFYADLRFSWGTDPHYLEEKLTEILDIADRVGCRVYDGQLDLWITRENLKDIAGGFCRAVGSIAKLFGTVDKKKYMAEMEKVLKEKTDNETGGN